MAQVARELTPYVSVRHFFGAELRWWRVRAGLSHDRLGALVNYSGDLVGKVEKAERVPTVALAQACDEVLGTEGALGRLVGLVEAAGRQESVRRVVPAPERPVRGWLLAGQAPTVGKASARGAGPVNRLEFLVSTFGAGAGSLFGSTESAEAVRLGPEDVVSGQRSLARLYELEAEYGGGMVYGLALRSLRKLRRILQRASYSESTGELLHTIAGELAKHAGWLAFDAGLHAEARYWWLDASHTARFIDDDRLLVGVFRLMSQQAGDLDRAREATELAQAAQQAAHPWGTPRLRSNLLVREAVGHARVGDEQATWQVFHQAEALFGAGPHDDDPPWLYFWDEADLACCQMRAALALGQLPLAERCSRTALTAVRPEHSRNRVSYLTHHAAVLVEQRNIEEAVFTAAQAVQDASELSSARIDARIGRVRTELTRYSDQPKVAEFLNWSGQIMATKANRSVLTT
ncbi:MAG: helix-turn-helix domain-containing protein [Pseudonocardiaceae bacterium]